MLKKLLFRFVILSILGISLPNNCLAQRIELKGVKEQHYGLKELNPDSCTELVLREAWTQIYPELFRFNKVEKLIMQEFKVDSLDLSIFNVFPMLKELEISHSILSHVSTKGFKLKLKILKIEFCQLQDVSNLLNDTLGLSTLELSNNLISEINLNSVNDSIRYLDISNNYLKDISFVKRIPNLRYIVAKGNRINRIIDMSDFKSLQVVELSYNDLKDSMILHKMPKGLMSLNVIGNYIERINTNNVLLPKFNYFYASNNRVSKFPDFSNLPSVVLMELGCNRISDFRFSYFPAIYKRRSVLTINLAYNELSNDSIINEIRSYDSENLSIILIGNAYSNPELIKLKNESLNEAIYLNYPHLESDCTQIDPRYFFEID